MKRIASLDSETAMPTRHASQAVLAGIAFVVSGCGGGGSDQSNPVVSITATGGSGQSAQVSQPFASPLVATVTTNGSADSGVAVTFTAAASGASGTFANGMASETDMTNASGVATSSTFTANSTAGGPYTVTASVSGASTPTSFSLTNTPVPVPALAATSGTPQSAAISTQFSAPLVATVTTGGAPTSGVAVTFTAPASGASGTFANGTVTEVDTTDANGVATSSAFTANSTIGAYAVAATATGVSTPTTFALTNLVAITLANGTYLFTLSGQDQFASSGASCEGAANVACTPYFVGGAFTVSNGSITGGEQDFIDGVKVQSDQITGGAVTATASGNLQITLITADTSIGVNGVETLRGSLETTAQATLTEFDASAISGGTLAQQAGTIAAPTGGYTFQVHGIDGANKPVSIGGVINIDTPGNISGAGSSFDINDDETVSQSQSFAASTVSAPDSFGRVEFSLVPSTASAVKPINLIGYILGPQHIFLVEAGDTFQGTMGGLALGQGTHTGQFSSASIAGSSFVFTLGGNDANGGFDSAGVITANSNGTVSGTINHNDLTAAGVQTPASLTGGTYTVDSTGRVTLTGVTDGAVTFNLQLYVSGNGDANVVSMDTTDVLSGYANQQSNTAPLTAASFAGLYGVGGGGTYVESAGGTNYRHGFDVAGLISADGVSALNGTVDLDVMTPPATQTSAVPASGMFTSNANGVLTGTITGLDVASAARADAVTFYLIDSTRAVAIETDNNQLMVLRFRLQQ